MCIHACVPGKRFPTQCVPCVYTHDTGVGSNVFALTVVICIGTSHCPAVYVRLREYVLWKPAGVFSGEWNVSPKAFGA